jgi:hypothetical protein
LSDWPPSRSTGKSSQQAQGSLTARQALDAATINGDDRKCGFDA